MEQSSAGSWQLGRQPQCRRMIYVSGFGLKSWADAADNKGGLLVARLAEFFSLFLLDLSKHSRHQSPIEAQGEPPRRQPLRRPPWILWQKR